MRFFLGGKELLIAKVVASTWLASGTWTIPAVTLGGTVSGANQTYDAGGGTFLVKSTAENAIIVYKPVNTVGARTAYVFSLENSTPVLHNYGAIYMKIIANTAGSESGQLQWFVRDGGAFNEAMNLSSPGALWTDASVDTLLYKVSGTQVVSAQGAAVANPTDAASTQARLIDLLGRLRTHGLIAT